MGAERNEEGKKWCSFGKGHWVDPSRFFNNATKSDGLNGICSYHQGVVNERNRK